MTKFDDLSIGQRMAIGFGVLLLILAALFAMVYMWQQDSAEAQRQMTRYTRPVLVAAERLQSDIGRVAINLRTYLLHRDDVRLDDYRQAARAVRSRLQDLRAMPKGEQAEALLAAIEPAVERYVLATDEAASALRFEAESIETEIALQTLRETAVVLVQSLVNLQNEMMTQALEVMEQAQSRVNRGLVAVAVSAILLFLFLAWLITESIRRPTRQLVGVATALEAGDWAPAMAWAGPPPGEVNGPPIRNEMVYIGRAFAAAAIALEQREQRLDADRQVARAAGSSLQKSEMASQALHAILAYVGGEVGIVYRVNEDTAQIEPVATYGLSQEAAKLAVGEGLPGQAARERSLLLARDIPRDSGLRVKLGYDEAPARDVAALPILFREEVLGVLLVASLRPLHKQALEFLETAATQLGVGMNNVKAYLRIQKLLQELAEQSQQIQTQNEELQAQYEEIQAQNEEVQAQNEELQAQGEEIRAQNDQLAELADRLQRHAAMLADADQRKNEFLGLLAHELRNPMAGISNSLFVLERLGVDGQQAANAQAVIRRQTKQLNRLIDDLLDVTRITQGKVTLRTGPLDLGKVVQQCLEDYRAELEKARLELAVQLADGPLMIEGDQARLCQIIGNLIDNAAKFSDSGRRVEVTLQADQAAGRAELSISDEGVGIDEAAFAHLFEPFTQGDPGRSGGLGLGLSLVKALVELHGGTVTAHSDGPGKGARFVVSLPLLHRSGPTDEQAPAATAPTQSVIAPNTPCRILIIEDNVDVALSLATALRVDGHDLRIAHTAEEGLAIARSFYPDVLLCDIGLPVMDGYEVARRFRTDDALKSVFLVAVTGYASEKDQEQAAQAGFDRHMPKPANLEQLSSLLAEVAVERARRSSSDIMERDQ